LILDKQRYGKLNLSYWEEKYYFEDNDLVVIGAGIVGLSTAIAVKKFRPDLKVLVLERSTIPSGASTKNAGFACFGSVTELISDSVHMKYEDQIALLKMRWDGLKLLQSNVTLEDMSYRSRGGVEVLEVDDVSQITALNNINKYNEMVSDAIGLKDCFSIVDQHLSDSFHSKAIYNQYEGELNPMHMMSSLQRKASKLGVNILNGVDVQSVYSGVVNLVTREIESPKIAVCTNGLSRVLLPQLALQAVRNQVFVTELLVNNPLQSCYHFDQGYVYFREIDNRILIGGARNLFSEQENTDQFGQTDNLKAYLKSFVEERITKRPIQFEYEWSGILGVGETKEPIIEEVDKGLYVGVRLGGMGVAIGSGVGQSLAEMVLS